MEQETLPKSLMSRAMCWIPAWRKLVAMLLWISNKTGFYILSLGTKWKELFQGWVAFFFQEMPDNRYGREEAVTMSKYPEGDAGTATDSASVSSAGSKMYFWPIGSSSHRKQKVFMPTGSKEVGEIYTILSLLVVIRFFIIQVVLRNLVVTSCPLCSHVPHAVDQYVLLSALNLTS